MTKKTMDYSATAFEVLRKLFASVFNWIFKRKKQFADIKNRVSSSAKCLPTWKIGFWFKENSLAA